VQLAGGQVLAGGDGFLAGRSLAAFQLNLLTARAEIATSVVVTGIAAAAESGIAAEAEIAVVAEAVLRIAADLGIAAGVGKLLETGTAGAETAGAEVDAGILAEGSAEAAKLVFGQRAQTGQNHQSPGCFQTVLLAAEPSGSQRIQRPGAAAGQLDRRQTGCRRLGLKTGSKLFLSSAAVLQRQ